MVGRLYQGFLCPARAPTFELRSLAFKDQSGYAIQDSDEGWSDIHGYAKAVRREFVLISESTIPEEDQKALVEFSEVMREQSLHTGRVIEALYLSPPSVRFNCHPETSIWN